MTELQWERKLKISTIGRDASHSDSYRYPYEPTPYCVLERLANSGLIAQEHTLVDYGCGKGRVGFFLSSKTGCKSVGVEYDSRVYIGAIENLRTYAGNGSVEFVCERAEKYDPDYADCFYFFNPFSVEVLRSVFGRLLESYYADPRRMRLFFYYPSEAYSTWLMTHPFLHLTEELDCRDLFPGANPRERILVFEIDV